LGNVPSVPEFVLNLSCQDFLDDYETLLEEYYHVLEQWNTGRISHLGYLWKSRHGYDNNPIEIEAKQFARDHAQELDRCLQKQFCGN
jgi:hypothetical protein